MIQLDIKLNQDSSSIPGLYFAVGEESSLHLAEDTPKLLRKFAICLLVMILFHEDFAGAIEVINDDPRILYIHYFYICRAQPWIRNGFNKIRNKILPLQRRILLESAVLRALSEWPPLCRRGRQML